MRRPLDILVYGATGYVGQLVVEELHRRKLAFGMAGRSSEGFAQLATRYEVPAFDAALTNVHRLAAVFSQARAVVACAGPYCDTGAPLFDAAVQARTHLLDLSGEPRHLRDLLLRDKEAKQAGIAVICSAGFDVIPAELLGWLAGKSLGRLSALELATGHLNGAPSRGTLRSYLTMATAPAECGLAWADGALVAEPLGHHRRVVPFLPPLGSRAGASTASAEIVLLPRSLDVRNLRHYVATAAPVAVDFAERGLPIYCAAALRRSLEKLSDCGLQGPDVGARAENMFFLWCRATALDGTTNGMTMQGTDPYGLSASLISSCAAAALTPDFRKVGVLTPLQAFDPVFLLALLANAGVRWRRAE
jgi:short subunit dehydrogenase-like uncharacterized protein